MEDKVIVKVNINMDIEAFKDSVSLELKKFEGKNLNEANVKEIAKMLKEKLKESLTISRVK